MSENIKKRILLYSTLNPYPFWAGSESFWFDFVSDARVNSRFDFHLFLADSPATRAKGEILGKKGITTDFYKHFNVNFTRRNFYRLTDSLRRKTTRTLPWFNQIKKAKYDLVWFNVAALADLRDLIEPVRICKALQIPYWLIL